MHKEFDNDALNQWIDNRFKHRHRVCVAAENI